MLRILVVSGDGVGKLCVMSLIVLFLIWCSSVS